MKKIIFVFSLSALAAAPFFARAQEASSQREAIHQAFAECHEELGLAAPQPGQKPPTPPSAEERAAMDACLTEKGIDVTQLKKFHPHRVPGSESSANNQTNAGTDSSQAQ